MLGDGEGNVFFRTQTGERDAQLVEVSRFAFAGAGFVQTRLSAIDPIADGRRFEQEDEQHDPILPLRDVKSETRWDEKKLRAKKASMELTTPAPNPKRQAMSPIGKR